uniref:Uncharacterized protein n=1 Tax=Arundo donax TaxID=35708 RepID=A0A0A8ZVF5_ARUDO
MLRLLVFVWWRVLVCLLRALTICIMWEADASLSWLMHP